MIIAPRCVAEQFMNDQAVPFDTVLRNLRYGYPLSPQVWCMVKPRGHFILAVPVFEDRHQCSFSWNLQHLTANSARRCLGFLVHFASKFCVLLYWQRYCTALEQWASASLQRGTRNGITELSQIYSAGRPSRRPTFYSVNVQM